jgi:predicted RNA binding protein YcfA (HicA-like mRNA interferase family)
VKAREVNRLIEKNGGVMVRPTGSHRRYRVTREGATAETVVPQHHSRDIRPPTLRGIERDLEPVLGKEWLR